MTRLAKFTGALLLAALFAPSAIADDADAIRARLEQWTADFNAGNAEAACDLFSRDLVSVIPGEGEADYQTRCDIITGALADPDRTLHYRLSIRDIIVEGSLATAVVYWSLRMTPGDTIVNEVGLDVFRKEDDGQWRIVRFVSWDEQG
jgi:ketosteroid isomerase-like protein